MPWRRSLFVRLFALAAVIVVIAVAATTWATVNATTVAVRENQQESLHADAQAYDQLVEYAATHRSWEGAASLVRDLAGDAGHPITVTDPAGRVLIDSEGRTATRSPSQARATLDALDVDTVLREPFELEEVVAEVAPVDCGSARDCAFYAVTPTRAVDSRVRSPYGTDTPTSEWRKVERRVNRCLRAEGLPAAIGVQLDFRVLVHDTGDHAVVVARCADEARRLSLAPYVAPPALMFGGDDDARADVLLDLSGASQARIGLVAGAVLAVTLLLCALLAASIVRPLRRMALVAQRAGDGDLRARVPVRRHDEVGEVGVAFNRMAERRQADETARIRLTSDVSHDLRTPIANVRGWLEAAQDGLVETDRALLDSLHDETLLLQRLVDDLRDLSLGDAGALALEPEALDVDDLLGQVVRSFSAAAEAAGVRLSTTASPGASVHADPVRLRQALGNLVANALQHTAPGGGVVLHGDPDRIRVVDDGEGIPVEDLPHVFDRFRRVDRARSRSTGGSGLGLAIVQQIVDAHAGTVSIESELGVGTVVTVRLAPGSPGIS